MVLQIMTPYIAPVSTNISEEHRDPVFWVIKEAHSLKCSQTPTSYKVLQPTRQYEFSLPKKILKTSHLNFIEVGDNFNLNPNTWRAQTHHTHVLYMLYMENKIREIPAHQSEIYLSSYTDTKYSNLPTSCSKLNYICYM